MAEQCACPRRPGRPHGSHPRRAGILPIDGHGGCACERRDLAAGRDVDVDPEHTPSVAERIGLGIGGPDWAILQMARRPASGAGGSTGCRGATLPDISRAPRQLRLSTAGSTAGAARPPGIRPATEFDPLAGRLDGQSPPPGFERSLRLAPSAAPEFESPESVPRFVESRRNSAGERLRVDSPPPTEHAEA